MSAEPEAPLPPFSVPSGVRIEGQLRPPASKSLTQRGLNLGLLADHRVVLVRPLLAEDSILFRDALTAVGKEVVIEGDSWVIDPGRPRDRATLACGNNGTMLRFLIGALSTKEGVWVLDGSARLRQRPIGPLVTALREIGARIEYLAAEGFAPVRIRGDGLRGGRVELDAGLSSQFASSLLMAATRSDDEVEVLLTDLASRTYLELTVAAMLDLGARVDELEWGRYRVRPRPPAGGEVQIEPDFSSAAYPAAAAVLTGGRVLLEDLRADSLQADRRFFDLLGELGAEIDWVPAGVTVQGTSSIVGVESDLSAMPDQVPTLAALAPFAEGRTTIRNVAHLRIKESDRIDAMCSELQRVGAIVEEHRDGLSVTGSWAAGQTPDSAVEVDSHNDHRIAMSLAVLGLRRPGVMVKDPGVVSKSYPDFWRDLENLIQR